MLLYYNLQCYNKNLINEQSICFFHTYDKMGIFLTGTLRWDGAPSLVGSGNLAATCRHNYSGADFAFKKKPSAHAQYPFHVV